MALSNVDTASFRAQRDAILRVPAAERWAENSVLVAFAFHCNLACTFCMVEDVLNVYEGTSLGAFQRYADQQSALENVSRIIFSGGEVTLAKNLLEYVRFARSLPNIHHVRIQTNATRLADRAFLKTLIDNGVDEYFVSMHGHDAPTCDAITQRQGSFHDILNGIAAIKEAGATLITNTAVAAQNVSHLPEIVSLLAPYSPHSMEFWTYWPRADERGTRGHFVRMSDIQAPLLAALSDCVKRGISPAVKWFPKCLLGPFAKYHDDGQPKSVIPDDYFEREPSYACVYEGICEEAIDLAAKGTPASGRCAGLSEPYIRHFGWEENVLSPKRKTLPIQNVSRSDVTHSLIKDAGPRRTDSSLLSLWLEPLGLAIGRPLSGFVLRDVVPQKGKNVLSLAFVSDTSSVAVRIRPRNEKRPAPLRTRSFDFSYQTSGDVNEAAVRSLVTALLSAFSAADQGGLSLPMK